jgi:hypothetical protein
VSRPLFIPLRTEHYNAFAAGTKTTEYRCYGPGWNEKTCTIGRPVTLSKGYGKAHRRSGRIVGFKMVWGEDLDEATQAAVIDCFGTDTLYLAAIRIELDPTPTERT